MTVKENKAICGHHPGSCQQFANGKAMLSQERDL